MPEPNRRASHIGLLRPTIENVTAASTEKPLRRRQSIAGLSATHRNGIRVEEKKETVPSTPSSSRKHAPHRTKLGAASAYYFSGLPKTPLDKAASSRKKLASSIQHQENSVNMSFDAEGYVQDYDGSLPAVETSYLSSSSGSSSGDALNRSVLSDTTELTASNFVFATQSRQLLSLAGNRRDSSVLQSKDTTPALLLAGQTSEAVNEARPPLAGVEGSKPLDRRKTLPPGYMAQRSAIASQSPSNRRDSWQGASDSDHDETKERAMGLLAAMRQRRLKRQSAGSRLSVGSAFSSDANGVKLSRLADVEDEGLSPLGGVPAHDRAKYEISVVLPVLGSPKLSISDNDLVERQGIDGNDSEQSKAMEDEASKPYGLEPSEARTSSTSLGVVGLVGSPKPSTANGDSEVASANAGPAAFVAGVRLSASDTAAEKSLSSPSEMTIEEKISSEILKSAPLCADDDSIASAGSLFDDILSKSKEQTATDSAEFTLRPSLASELFQVDELLDRPMPSNMKPNTSKDSSAVATMVVEESEYQEAALQTVVGFASRRSHLGSSTDEPNPTKSPRPLPDMVAFDSQNASESLLAEATSPFRLKPAPKSSGVTPSKLEPSPRRVPNPSAIDSPARNTRSRLSLLSDEKKRKLDEAIDIGQESLETKKKRRESSVASVSLNSSFRKGPKQQGSARKVAFGSPEFMEYNITSPSVSMTPMPKRTPAERDTIPDDTVEIEADMNALFQNMNHPEIVDQLSASVISTAGGTPFVKRRLSEDGRGESTIDLEMNLQDVLDQAEDKPSEDTEDDAKSDMSDDSQAHNLVGEQTEALEVSMGELLTNTTPYRPNMETESPSTMGQTQAAVQEGEEEEDRTVELEVDMSALLDAAEGPEEPQKIEMAEESTSIAQRRRRSSIASKRFSLEPKSRFSLSGIFPDETTEDSDAAEIVVAMKIEPVLELKIGDILSMNQSVEQPSVVTPDIFAQTSHFLKENPSALSAESLNTFLQEVCDYLEVYDTPGVDPNLIAQLSKDEQSGVLKLQEGLKSKNRAAVESSVGRLLNSSKQCEGLAWNKWLLDTAEQLKEHLSGYHGEVQAELLRLARDAQLVDDTESLLSSIQERAFKKARRTSLERRKVR
jgi:hypothetical protein